VFTFAALLVVSPATAQGPSGDGSNASSALIVTPVQGNVYMISGAGPHLTVQVGRYGPVLVDVPAPALVPRLLAEIRKLSPRPVHLLLHTTGTAAATAGNATLLAGTRVREALVHNTLYNRLLETTTESLPFPQSTITYSEPMVDTSNGEAIIIYQARAAITDADSIVFFRRSDVISTGAIFTPGRYPTIDGVIDAVFKVLEVAVPGNLGEGGTLIVPASGRVSEESDLGEYRNMLVIIRERIRDLRSKGMTLEQIKASRPSLDYDTEYHATRAEADRFVEVIYRTMATESTGAAATAERGRR
jgi:hypothetical protein